jgi:hypothetical protein
MIMTMQQLVERLTGETEVLGGNQSASQKFPVLCMARGVRSHADETSYVELVEPRLRLT